MYFKRDSTEEYSEFKFIPVTFDLRDCLEDLLKNNDTQIWQYGKQLYWILHGYFKGFLLLQTIVLGRKDAVNVTNFLQAT